MRRSDIRYVTRTYVRMFGFLERRVLVPQAAGRYDVVVVVLTLSHGYNAVRGHRTGSNDSGAEDYLRKEPNKKRR